MPSEKIKAEVAALAKAGLKISLVEVAGQWFVVHEGLEAPAPPWGATAHDTAIAVPLVYETAGLDAFYLRLPYTFNGGVHPRVSGPQVKIGDHQWQLVSWHYPDDKRWLQGQDDLANHIEHCRGFFLNRKATNAY
jgi:hypothetical protein